MLALMRGLRHFGPTCPIGRRRRAMKSAPSTTMARFLAWGRQCLRERADADARGCVVHVPIVFRFCCGHAEATARRRMPLCVVHGSVLHTWGRVVSPFSASLPRVVVRLCCVPCVVSILSACCVACAPQCASSVSLAAPGGLVLRALVGGSVCSLVRACFRSCGGPRQCVHQTPPPQAEWGVVLSFLGAPSSAVRRLSDFSPGG